MKAKPSLLLLFTAILSLTSCSSDDSGSNGNTNNARVKSITWQEYYIDQWRNNYKTTYTYQGNNTAASSSLTQNYYNETWNDNSRSFFTLYNNQVSEQIDQRFNFKTGWVNQMRYTFTYNANNKCVKKVSEIWTTDNNWFLRYRNDYLYDSSSFMITDQTSEWLATPAVWSEPFDKLVFINNSDGKPIRTEHFYDIDQLDYVEITNYDTNRIFLNSERFSESFNGVSYVSLRTEQTTLPNGNIDKITKTYFDPDGKIYRQSRFLYEY